MESREASAFDAEVSGSLRRWSVAVSPEQLVTLRAHFDAVIQANRVMNLTRITDPIDAAAKHYSDSLALLPWVAARKINTASLLDVGTGAGFPAVPLAVLRPDWQLTAIDATRKKVDFVRRTAEVIGLANLHVEHAHSDHWDSAEKFQLVSLRAVTRLARCLVSCAKFVAPGGWLIAYKTASLATGELEAATTVAARLRLKVEEPFEYELKLGSEVLGRALYAFHKPRRTAGGRR